MKEKKIAEELVGATEEVADKAAETVTESEVDAADNAAAEAEDIMEEIQEAETVLKEDRIEEEKEEGEEGAAESAEEDTVLEEEQIEEEKEDEASDEKKKKAVSKEPPIIKKKKKLDKINVIVITVCAVIVLACLAFVGYKSGWFKMKQKAKIEMDDYSVIEVLKADVEVTDEAVDEYITKNILQKMARTEEVTEGVVADGDQLNIDYVGTLTETGEVFEGGSAQGQSLTIGSGTMIDGFESSLVGAEIGQVTTINVVFPEDYGSTDLAGKAASFDVTVNSKTVTVEPELTDAFVLEYSRNYFEKELTTVKELKEYIYDYIYSYQLHDAMWKELQKKEHVISYDEDAEAMLIQYSMDYLDYSAAMYGTTAEQIAMMYGYAGAEEYAKEDAHFYLDRIMLADQIIKDMKVKWTDEDFNLSLALYMARNGYSEQYTMEEFMEQSGETWVYIYENFEFKFHLAMESIESHVVLVDEKTETEEVTTEEAPLETESAVN